MKILGLVPARGGSKSVPGKNLKLLGGKPLIQWTVECAELCEVFDRLVLSTESKEIAAVGESLGLEVPFLRPDVLAGDDSPMLAVVLHALEALATGGYKPDAIAILQPTSPFRRPEHVIAARDALASADSVCSVVKLPPELSPHYVMKVDEEGWLKHFLPDGDRYIRRQDAPPAYRRDGTIYLVKHESLARYQSLYGPRCLPMLIDERDSLSIDSQADWDEAERRVRAGRTGS